MKRHSAAIRGTRVLVWACVLVGGSATAWAIGGSGTSWATRRTALNGSGVFAAVELTRTGARVLTLRSAATGSVATVLQRDTGKQVVFSTQFGFVFSGDGRDLYATSFARRGRFSTTAVVRFHVPSRRSSFIAYGAEPAVSPDGEKLAYAALRVGALPIAIRDLATGRTRSINLDRLAGPGENLLNASLVWLAGGTDLAVIPAHNSSPGFSPTNSGSRNANACPTGFSSTCLIVVHLGQAGRPLSARRFTIPVPAKFDVKDEQDDPSVGDVFDATIAVEIDLGTRDLRAAAVDEPSGVEPVGAVTAREVRARLGPSRSLGATGARVAGKSPVSFMTAEREDEVRPARPDLLAPVAEVLATSSRYATYLVGVDVRARVGRGTSRASCSAPGQLLRDDFPRIRA